MKPDGLLYGVCRSALDPMPALVASAAGDRDNLAAVVASDRRQSGKRGARRRIGCARLSSARRSQYLFAGPGRYRARSCSSRASTPPSRIISRGNPSPTKPLRNTEAGGYETIVLVGHSSGATVLPDMVARLDQLGVPVTLAIGLDSVFQTSLSGHVGRYLNFYVANGGGTQVEKTRAVPWRPGECRRRRNGCRTPLHRQERGHAAEGHQRDRRRRL